MINREQQRSKTNLAQKDLLRGQIEVWWAGLPQEVQGGRGLFGSPLDLERTEVFEEFDPPEDIPEATDMDWDSPVVEDDFGDNSYNWEYDQRSKWKKYNTRGTEGSYLSIPRF